MSQTLGQKLTYQWIAIAVLAAAVLLLRTIGWMTASHVLVLVAILIFVFGIVPTWARSLSGSETAEEAAARQAQGSRVVDKLASREEELARSDKAEDPLHQTALMYEYALQWDKTSNPIPNGLTEGWRASPIDIYDGDFALLAKQRALMEKLTLSDRKPDKWVKKLQKLDRSIEQWRKGGEELRDGTREGPDHFDAEDFLRRLNAAFPPDGTGPAPPAAEPPPIIPAS